MKLDHVAVAVEHWEQAWPLYVSELGGRWASGGLNVGFAPAQLSYANGAKIEVLQPHAPDANPFLRRFLDQHGPGPHHVTFKVPDLASALEALRDAGLHPVGVNMSMPWWMEAFIHPREGTGIVIQLAQAAGEWSTPPPEGFPAPTAPQASLVRVVHAVASMERGLAVFEGLLGGSRSAPQPHRGATADGEEFEAVDLSWGGPLSIRLISPVEATSRSQAPALDPAAPSGRELSLGSWLLDRPGRVHHVAFATSDRAILERLSPVADLPGADPGREALVVEPAENNGTRVVLYAEETDAP